MVDITHKIITQRTATAQAIVKVGSPETVKAILDKTVPKGDVLEVARTAGLFAVKNTSNSIPDCHPMPIEYTGIDYEFLEDKFELCIFTCYLSALPTVKIAGLTVPFTSSFTPYFLLCAFFNSSPYFHV